MNDFTIRDDIFEKSWKELGIPTSAVAISDHRPYRSDVPSLGVRPQNGFSKSREAQILQTPIYFPSMTFQRLERSKPLCYHE